jgi:hypothetical protein
VTASHCLTLNLNMISCFVDFRMEPKPLLVIEYLPLGDLEAQHKDYGIAEADMMVIFN